MERRAFRTPGFLLLVLLVLLAAAYAVVAATVSGSTDQARVADVMVPVVNTGTLYG
jgi:multidrug resistance efflux pump